jgi:hypothetical protein
MLATPQNHPICAEGQRRRVKGAADLFLPLHLGRWRWQVDVEERHESGHGEQQGGSPDREGGSSMEGAPRLVVEIRPRARSMAAGFWAHNRGERRWSKRTRTPGSYNPMVGHPNGTGRSRRWLSSRPRSPRRRTHVLCVRCVGCCAEEDMSDDAGPHVRGSQA